MVILEVIGWIGSILIVLSLTQARVWRFRWMNLIGSVIATGYNAIIEAWPFVFMNAAIVVINAYWLVRLTRERHDERVYQVLRVDADDAFVAHLLDFHAKDIAAHAPGFVATATPARHTFLVVHGDEAVGVVAVADAGAGLGVVELDWVTPRFRDFTPGEFVYRESRVLAEAGFGTLEIAPHDGEDEQYLRRVGFYMSRGRWVRKVGA